MSGPALVILAAGASERLGTCKALVDLGGRTPLSLLLAAGAALDAAPALVITGPDHERIAAAAPEGVEVAPNTAWRAGRTGSVQLAHRLRPGLALCLSPVDVPRVPRAVFARLREAWIEAGEPPAGWLAPRAGGPRPRHGHPVVLGPLLLEQGTGLAPDTPLWSLRGRARPLLAVPVTGPETLEDLDSPADLARLRAWIDRAGT